MVLSVGAIVGAALEARRAVKGAGGEGGILKSWNPGELGQCQDSVLRGDVLNVRVRGNYGPSPAVSLQHRIASVLLGSARKRHSQSFS